MRAQPDSSTSIITVICYRTFLDNSLYSVKILCMRNRFKWVKNRHKVITFICRLFLIPYLRIKYNVKIERIKDARKRPYLILYNHQTPFDQFMISVSCPAPVYYVATEDIFSIGFISRLLNWTVAPIPIKKSGNDLKATKTCIRVAKEGGTIAIAPEGNRTYSGETCYIKPSIVKLAKSLKLPIAFMVFEGGYCKQPRWSNYTRTGKMTLKVRSILEYDDFANISDEELYEIVLKELYVDDSNYPEANYHKRNAENLERLIYVCPECGLSEFESAGDRFACNRCGLSVRYNERKNFEKTGESFQFENVRDWYKYQNEYINKLDLHQFDEDAAYADTKLKCLEVVPYKKKNILSNRAVLKLYGNRFELKLFEDTEVIPFEKIDAIALCGRNKMNVYTSEITYQFKGDKSFNPMKYLNFYHRRINQTKEETSGEKSEFLGM